MATHFPKVALVLACDLTIEGELGPHTLSRLRRGFNWHKAQKAPIVVAAGRSPYHPDQPLSMAELMRRWIQEKGFFSFVPVIVKRAPTFDTRGELTAFSEIVATEYVIITAWWHLPRARLIAWQVFPKGSQVTGVADWEDWPTLKQLVLEVPKYIHTMLPPRWRIRARGWWEKLFGQSSW